MSGKSYFLYIGLALAVSLATATAITRIVYVRNRLRIHQEDRERETMSMLAVSTSPEVDRAMVRLAGRHAGTPLDPLPGVCLMSQISPLSSEDSTPSPSSNEPISTSPPRNFHEQFRQWRRRFPQALPPAAYSPRPYHEYPISASHHRIGQAGGEGQNGDEQSREQAVFADWSGDEESEEDGRTPYGGGRTTIPRFFRARPKEPHRRPSVDLYGAGAYL